MNGLEIFAIVVIAFIFYFLFTGLISAVATDLDSEMFGVVAWFLGGLLFMCSAVAWALKAPFPL